MHRRWRRYLSNGVDGFWHRETADEADGVEKREKEDDVRDGAVGEAQESPKRAEPAR